VIKWSIDDLQGKSKLSFGASYCVSPLETEAIVDKVRWEVRARIMAKGTFMMSTENLDLIHVLNLTSKILI